MKVYQLIAILILATTGCSHLKKTETEKSQALCIEKKTEPRHINMDAFFNSPDLNATQKEQLKAIYARTMGQARKLSSELAAIKSQMFQTLATKDYKSKQVTDLKAQIIAIDKKRLDVMFEALSAVQGVVGYGEEKEKIYRQLRDYDLDHADKLYSL